MAVAFAKRKKPQSRASLALQALLLLSLSLAVLLVYRHFALFHRHLTHWYAYVADDPHAQHLLAHQHLARSNHSVAAADEAFALFRRSAAQGHAHSAYNLAVGHLSGFRTDVRKGTCLLSYCCSCLTSHLCLHNRRGERAAGSSSSRRSH